jgi:hypothetical protein
MKDTDIEYITLVSKAIRKNGLPQTFGQYVGYRVSEPGSMEAISACAIGQASINLNLIPEDITLVLDNMFGSEGMMCPAKHCNFAYELGSLVIHLNDMHKWKFSSIANFLMKVANGRYVP